MLTNEEGIRAKSKLDGNNVMDASKSRSGLRGSSFVHLEGMEVDGAEEIEAVDADENGRSAEEDTTHNEPGYLIEKIKGKK